MIYDYKCNSCEHRYERQNKMNDRKKGGRCPKCTSSDTVQTLSAPKFKTCGTGHGEGWDGKGEMK